jgi:hypothetical protein
MLANGKTTVKQSELIASASQKNHFSERVSDLTNL